MSTNKKVIWQHVTFGCLGWGGSFGSDGGGNKQVGERERATVFWDVKNESIKNSAASYCDKQIEDENKSSQKWPVPPWTLEA